MDEFIPPTYEEYTKASSFARVRYKYGLIVTVGCWLCLLFIIYYIVSNGRAISSNPLVYGSEDMDINCECFGNSNKHVHFYVNGSSIWLPEQESSQPVFTEEDLKLLLDKFGD